MPATTDPKTSQTEYVILNRDESETWAEIERVYARKAEQAIRTLKSAGVYVAIPARSFKPVTVTAEIQTTLKITAA